MRAVIFIGLAACSTNLTPQPDPTPVLPNCVPNRDGQITADELPIAYGFTVDYYAGTNRTVNLAPTNGIYDLSVEAADDAVVALGPIQLAAQWYADQFPTGQFTVDAGSGLDGIYHQDDRALWLDGTASQAAAPAAGKTLIRYSTELLSADLPVPPDAPDPRYNDGDKSLRFEWPGEAADAVVAFYLKRLPKQGWEATTERPVFNEKWKTQYLIFRNEQGDMISLDLIKYTGIVRVKVQHRTAAEVKEMDRQLEEFAERRRQELA